MREQNPISTRYERPSAPFVHGALFALAFAVVLFVVSDALAEDGGDLITDIEDLPIMPGLNEVPDAGLVFDKPSGRIVQAYAEGQVHKTEVLDFYRQTLPQLGWRAEGRDRFAREDEALTLLVREMGDGVVVEFRLAPR
jgi:hypothetical protein